MRPDCGDMRFTDSDATTLIPYWIEPSTENTVNTKIWVKVPSILGSSTKTIYMYYGNPTASSATNGPETFVFFDDFSGGSLDKTKWSVTEYVDASQYYEVRNGELHVYAYSTRNPSGYKFTTKSSFNLDGFALYMKGR